MAEEGCEGRRVVLRGHDDGTERERVGEVRKMVTRNTKSGIWSFCL